METVRVEKKSAWLSKVNWTQAVALLASVLVIFGIDMQPEHQVALVGIIQGIQSLATWIIKTWFTKTVTPASVG